MSERRLSSEIVVVLFLVAAAIMLSWSGRTPGHPWGDDWAGYLLQSRALAGGNVRAEVETNALAMAGGDVQVGPDAYPWGYPLMLAVAGTPGGGDIDAYKHVGLVSLALLVLFAYLLARAVAGPLVAAFVSIATSFQPAVVTDAAFLGSDVPFAAVATGALALTLLQWRSVLGGGGPRIALTVGVGALSALAFSIRSNGAVLPCTYLLMLALAAWKSGRRPRGLARDATTFVALTAALTGLYFLLLPDGSLSHAGYLSFDPHVWLERMVRHFHYVSSWVTLDLVRGPLKVIPFLAFVGVCLAGILGRPWEGLLLTGYVAAHLVLITVFPFDGGVRYYHPMLAPAFLLFALGFAGLAGRIFMRRVGEESRLDLAAGVALPALLLLTIGVARAEQRHHADPAPDAPFAPATAETMRFVASVAPAGARIGFFKPRAFRLLTGRTAYAISQPENLGRVDWYVFNGGTADTRTQVPLAALEEPKAGFRLVREIAPFRVYARSAGASGTEMSSSKRGLP